MKEREYFYSNGNAGIAISKKQYEQTYNMFMTYERVFEEWSTGDVFIIDGKEYILNENKKLDIPYGVDIYNIKYPPKTNV